MILLIFFFAVAAVQGLPSLVARQSSGYIPDLTPSQISAFNTYTYYAKAVYCDPRTTVTWTCGVACNGNKGFKPVATGGDGDSVQYWLIGYDPILDTIIVAHQGTNINHLLPILTDLDVIKEGLDPIQFPGLSRYNIEVHQGFLYEHAKTARTILSYVQSGISQYNTNSVTMVGHSLGAALALLDSVYLPLHLSRNTTFRTVVYGLPRVGNRSFANYVDANVHLTHINNLKDPVPIVPGMSLGYVHPSGEVHIKENGKWGACPGQDNEDPRCIVGDVPSVMQSVEANHDGPYNGIRMPCNT